MADLKDRAALESTLRFIDEKIKPRRCDSDGVSGCWRCQSVYLAKRMRELLAERDADGVRPVEAQSDDERAASTRLHDAISKADYALWVMLEHATLHFGDKHSNTTIAREALHELRAAVAEQARTAGVAVADPVQRTLDVLDEFERTHNGFHLDHNDYVEWIEKVRAELQPARGVGGRDAS